eukprot:3276065-Prymnesium_polylepis.1
MPLAAAPDASPRSPRSHHPKAQPLPKSIARRGRAQRAPAAASRVSRNRRASSWLLSRPSRCQLP